MIGIYYCTTWDLPTNDNIFQTHLLLPSYLNCFLRHLIRCCNVGIGITIVDENATTFALVKNKHTYTLFKCYNMHSRMIHLYVESGNPIIGVLQYLKTAINLFFGNLPSMRATLAQNRENRLLPMWVQVCIFLIIAFTLPRSTNISRFIYNQK